MQTGEAARLRMVKSNERLVWHVARKYQNRGLDTEDLIAEGMNGLLKGVEKFDPNKGFKFSTYAHWWVRQGITRAISEQVLPATRRVTCLSGCAWLSSCAHLIFILRFIPAAPLERLPSKPWTMLQSIWYASACVMFCAAATCPADPVTCWVTACIS